MDHRVQGVDHVAFPTFDPAGTVRFYRDVLGFPVVHSICAAGWGPENHPDFIHFFFDIGNGDRLAFFYYFGAPAAIDGGPRRATPTPGSAPDVPEFFISSRHLAIHVDTRGGPAGVPPAPRRSDWPVEMQIQHETIESIYTHDPNGYMIEITRALRPVTPQEDLDAEPDHRRAARRGRRPGADVRQAAGPQGRADRRAARRASRGARRDDHAVRARRPGEPPRARRSPRNGPARHRRTGSGRTS